jgi:hypothetical protein
LGPPPSQTYANDLSNEQEKELVHRQERLQEQQEYVAELRARIAKLIDRENANEVSVMLRATQPT